MLLAFVAVFMSAPDTEFFDSVNGKIEIIPVYLCKNDVVVSLLSS